MYFDTTSHYDAARKREYHFPGYKDIVDFDMHYPLYFPSHTLDNDISNISSVMRTGKSVLRKGDFS